MCKARQTHLQNECHKLSQIWWFMLPNKINRNFAVMLWKDADAVAEAEAGAGYIW